MGNEIELVERSLSMDTVKKRMRSKDALDLRLNGFTYEQIAKSLSIKYKDDTYDIARASHDVRKEMDNIRVSIKETAADVLHMELERLDTMQSSIYPLALEGDLKAMAMVLKIMAVRADLLGLNKPKEIKINDWRSDLLKLLEDGKITVDQIRQEIGDELTRELIESRRIGAGESGEVKEGEFTEIKEVA